MKALNGKLQKEQIFEDTDDFFERVARRRQRKLSTKYGNATKTHCNFAWHTRSVAAASSVPRALTSAAAPTPAPLPPPG